MSATEASGPGRSRVAGLTLVGIVALANPAYTAEPSLRLVALTGQHAPGTPAGVTFAHVFGYRNGAFEAILEGPGVVTDPPYDNDHGIWVEPVPGQLELLVRERDPAPDLGPGILILRPDIMAANRDGQLAFAGALEGPGVVFGNALALWSGDVDGSASLLLRRGDPAPGTTETWSFFRYAAIGPDGRFALIADLNAPIATRSGLWAGTLAGGVELVVRHGDPVAELPPGWVHRIISRPPIWNAAGRMIFASTGDLGCEDDCLAERVYVKDPGEQPVLVAAKGDPAPGVEAGVTFDFVRVGGLDGNGTPALWGTLRGPGVWAANENGVWGPDGSGSVELIARSLEPAPGADPGFVFAGFRDDHPLVNESSQMALEASIIKPGSPPRQGIWAKAPNGPLVPIAITGQPFAGLPADETLFGFNLLGLDESGRLAVEGVLERVTDYEWFAAAVEPWGAPIFVLRPGDLLEVAPGDVRTVRLARPASWQEDGSLPVTVAFQDGSEAIFIVTLPPQTPLVPGLSGPPLAILGALLASMGLAAVHRRRRAA